MRSATDSPGVSVVEGDADAKAEDVQNKVKKSIDDDNDAESYLKIIKSSLTNLIQNVGGSWSSAAKFPWKDMPSRLAACGVILTNWPEGVPLPGTEQGTSRKSKGISALTLDQRKTLAAALKDQHNPPKFQQANPTGMC